MTKPQPFDSFEPDKCPSCKRRSSKPRETSPTVALFVCGCGAEWIVRTGRKAHLQRRVWPAPAGMEDRR